jgi:chromosome partitioning protein
MRVAVVASKGGAGKSSMAIALAGEALARGRTALLVDADHGQGTSLLWSETAGTAGKPAPTTVAMGSGMHRPDQLPKVAQAYDIVVIDTPGRLSDVQRSALMFADVALVVTGPSVAEGWALASAIEVVREAQTIRQGLKAAIVLTRKQPRTAVGKVARQGIEGGGLPVLRSEISYRVVWQECLALGATVSTHDRGDAALEVRRLYDEIEAFTLGDQQHGQEPAPARAAASGRRTRR